RPDTVSIQEDEYAKIAEAALARDKEVAESLGRLVATAREMNLPLASHDDNTPAMRQSFRELGCTLCEFPADDATSLAALAGGDEIILGSPNILRGGSHCGRVGAGEMIGRGLCTVLCSDYYYPALLMAPFVLAANSAIDFPSAWNLVSSGPARAAKLADRG